MWPASSSKPHTRKEVSQPGPTMILVVVAAAAADVDDPKIVLKWEGAEKCNIYFWSRWVLEILDWSMRRWWSDNNIIECSQHPLYFSIRYSSTEYVILLFISCCHLMSINNRRGWHICSRLKFFKIEFWLPLIRIQS
jgi:hypothetical protein